MKASGKLVFPIAMAALLSFPAARAAESDSDPKAVAIAVKTLDALGGQAAWESSRYFRFDFFGFRLHHWDRWTGRHRLEGKSREGVEYVVLQDLNARTGKVWLNGLEVTGEEAAKWLENGYGAFINDTYWLLMPYKMRDPGVHLAYDGEETIDGVVYDKLKLTFGKVGLTPGDTYWAYINRQTGLMDRWAYFLEDYTADKKPTVWLWQGWERHGQILLAGKRKNLEDGKERSLGQLGVFESLPDAVFSSPAKVVP
jgi:hypothetical protein